MIAKSPSELLAMTQTVCVFGAGALFQQCYAQIVLSLGKEPDFVCDNAPEKWGQRINGITCISPAELEALSTSVTVVIAVRNYENINKQLVASGITNVLIFSFDRSYNVINSLKKVKEGVFPHHRVQNLEHAGRWAFITGASRGIGHQIAISLAKLGINIIAHSRSLSHCENVVEQCQNLGVEAFSVEAELENTQAIDLMTSVVNDRVPSVDILVNSAGIAPRGLEDIWSQNASDFNLAFAVNTMAPILLCDYFIPKMISNGFGRVINLSSNIHHRPAEMAYSCSKAALDKYVFDISPTLENTGVLISEVDPGWLRTDMGGEQAPHDVKSVVPGAVLPVMISDYKNGQWFVAQDYAGLSTEQAITKFRFISHEPCID